MLSQCQSVTSSKYQANSEFDRSQYQSINGDFNLEKREEMSDQAQEEGQQQGNQSQNMLPYSSQASFEDQKDNSFQDQEDGYEDDYNQNSQDEDQDIQSLGHQNNIGNFQEMMGDQKYEKKSQDDSYKLSYKNKGKVKKIEERNKHEQRNKLEELLNAKLQKKENESNKKSLNLMSQSQFDEEAKFQRSDSSVYEKDEQKSMNGNSQYSYEYLVELNPTQEKQDHRKIYKDNKIRVENSYLKMELALEKDKKNILLRKLDQMIHRKKQMINPTKKPKNGQNSKINPNDNFFDDGKSEMKSEKTLDCERKFQDVREIKTFGVRRKNKKKRTQITTKILTQIQVLFRQYDDQERFHGTPLYRRRHTHRTIAETINLSHTEVKHLYDEFQTDPLFTLRMSKLLNPASKVSAETHEINQLRLRYLDEMINKNCVLTQQEIADQMNNVQELLQRDNKGMLTPVTRKHVQILLRMGNYSKKKVQLVPKNRNSPQTLQYRYSYCEKYFKLIKEEIEEDAKIFFLDESRFNMLTVRDRGWSKKGNPARKETVNSRGKDVILLAVINREGLFYYELSDGYNAAAFTISMDKIGKYINSHPSMQGKKRYIIMDNCPIHNRENLETIEKNHNVEIFYLPPYSPMLNPIEYWFSQIKSNIRQKSYKTRIQMKHSLEIVLEKYKERNMSCYYKCIVLWLDRGTKREQFK